MKIFQQVFILFSLCFLSEIISELLPFPFPSNVIGMILLLSLLLTHVLKTESIRDLSGFLLQNMAFFFIPSTVSVIHEFGLFKDKIFIMVFIAIFSLFVTFIVTAVAVQLTTKLLAGKKNEVHE